MQKVIVRSVCLLGVFFAGSLAASAQSGAGESLDGCTDCGGSVTWLESVPEESLASDAGCASILTRPRLTGDWHGYRTAMEECGVTFAGRSTHFAFGLGGGINAPVPSPLDQGDTFEYTGRGEYDLIFDLGKLGGLPGGSLLIRAEHWYGEFGNVSLGSGAFVPPVFPAFTPVSPNDPGVPFITNFLLTQPLSEKLVVFAGKKDVLGGADQDIFAGGDGTSQFINQALIANPAFLLALPYSSFTAGVALPQKWGAISVYVYDPQDRTTDFFRLNDLFSKGVIVGGEVQVKTNFFSMPGEHHVGGIWKHVNLVDLRFTEPPPGQYPYPTIPGVPTIRDSYTIYYGFDQYLKVYSDKPTKGWGVFGRASISDANPTPFRYFLSAGIGGNSPIGTNRGDRFGIGWYYTGTSREFGPVPRAVFGPRDGWGMEIFYNWQATPWLNVTPDFQIVKPGNGVIAETAYIGGVRLNITF